ncbi:DUF6794 domain-containing protein [Anaerobacterium chartisolvens]|uniref:DUF6794 domain-containing protein n=1 Tax=Anaerobacterium chartisolvens TaxID=1297424 RepID=UPI000DF46B35|nr:DUF6794 domain-containing protein [Anaerobacterium chartisolvens]
MYKNIKKNIPKIEKYLTEADLAEFLNTPQGDLKKYNVGFGTMIRLKLLTPKSALFKKFSQYGFNDKDEISLEIIKEFHKCKDGDAGDSPQK